MSGHETAATPALQKEGRATHDSAPQSSREWISRGFTWVEDLVYIGLGLLLAASAIVLRAFGALSLWRSLLEGTLSKDIVPFLDHILLILMIVEILSTVLVSFREHALTAEPFLIVGLIAGVRHILVLTAEFSQLLEAGEPSFRNAMIELGLLILLVVALVASLFMLRKPRSEPAAVRRT
jgi:uncharacterized membrane protein (DUF373 family)